MLRKSSNYLYCSNCWGSSVDVRERNSVVSEFVGIVLDIRRVIVSLFIKQLHIFMT